MKVLEVYDKNSQLSYNDDNVFKIMDQYFSKFPLEYRINYDNNLETLKIFKVDNFYDINDAAFYNLDNNTLYFSNVGSIFHEFVHMASSDLDKKKMAFIDQNLSYELGIVEGMTEYLAMQVLNRTSIITYCFETFCVSMLSHIDGIFKPYFVPSHEDFINLFPKKEDIYSLMYSLGYYSSFCFDSLGHDKESKIKKAYMREAICDTISTLIDIELSFNPDCDRCRLYVEKFMDLIMSKNIEYSLKPFFPKYKNYTSDLIRKRIIDKR